MKQVSSFLDKSSENAVFVTCPQISSVHLKNLQNLLIVCCHSVENYKQPYFNVKLICILVGDQMFRLIVLIRIDFKC